MLLLLICEAVMVSSHTFRNQLLQQTFSGGADCQTYASETMQGPISCSRVTLPDPV